METGNNLYMPTHKINIALHLHNRRPLAQAPNPERLQVIIIY